MTVTFDERMLEEFRRLFNNPAIEIQKYLKIHGNYIDLSQRQTELLQLIQKDRFVKEVGERETGMSTVLLISILIDIVTRNNLTIVFIARNTLAAKEFANKFRDLLAGLPDWLRPKITKNNVQEIRFENGCKVMFRTAAPEQLRGYAINRLYIDHYHSVSREFWNCIYPVISSSSNAKTVQFQTVDD